MKVAVTYENGEVFQHFEEHRYEISDGKVISSEVIDTNGTGHGALAGLKTIRDAYEQIKSEFDDYIDNTSMDEDDERAEIGRTIVKFRDTVKAEIPVCVIGNYSVGKSALVNSLIGRERLPSYANSTTAKNVLIENGDVYSIIFDYSDVHYNLVTEGSNIKKDCDGEIDEELISALISSTDVMPESIYVKRDGRVALICRYKFDAEHGMAVVFNGGKLEEVGSQDIIM